MTIHLLAAVAATALLPAVAAAQSMPGMSMPGHHAMPPAKPKPAAKPTRRPAPPRARPTPSRRPATPARRPEVAAPMSAADHQALGHAPAGGEPSAMPGMPMPADPVTQDAPAPAPTVPTAPAHDHAAMPAGKGGAIPNMDHAAMDHAAMPGMAGMASMIGTGDYSQGSGTARLPAAEGMMRGKMIHTGGWMLMAHGYAWGVATAQGGPRGRDMAFVESMGMLMGDRDLSDRVHLQLRSMLSLEPLMGQRGYPNLFASGETANGAPLVDRQHPHDLFMELSGRIDYRIGGGASLFVYGGPVAEPALGPSAFMHRGSARYQPLSPITHHWFDSTHITYGVVTAGYASPRAMVEASAFRGREPGENRWNIETPRLDSWSVRGTWTPTANWAVQVSHGRLEEPEAQHPGEDERRTTASVHYAANGVATTFAWSRKERVPGATLNALLAEATWEIDRHHVVFGRVEHVANDELFPDHTNPLHDRTFRVTRGEAGYAYRVPISGPFGVAVGGTVAVYGKPGVLDLAYGKNPVSGTVFAKLVLGL